MVMCLMLSVSEVHRLVAELAPQVVGGQVQTVREPDSETVVLGIRRPGKTTQLVLSARPGVARIAEAERKGSTLKAPSALGAWLRATLSGRRLVSMVAQPDDRVVVLGFEGGQLVVELTGRGANLFAVDDTPRRRVVAIGRAGAARGMETGKPLVPLAPPSSPSPGVDRGLSALQIEALAQQRLIEQAETERARAFSTLSQRATRRLDRLVSNLQRDLVRASAGDAAKRCGELLKGQLYRYERGMARVQLSDWHAEGAPEVWIELDPALDGPANVARFFRRYKKAKTALIKVTARLAHARAQLLAVEAAITAADGDPQRLLITLQRLGAYRPKATGGGTRKSVAPRLPYRPWVSSRGERILVGRGGADNHALTFRVARGNDWWLHVRDAPGAHVIVPQPAKGVDPHQETLRDAAALAARYSDLKTEAVVEVSLVQRKHVRPVKGAGPGRVTLAGARTLTVDVERLSGVHQEVAAIDPAGRR